jgi:hypothetical protein
MMVGPASDISNPPRHQAPAHPSDARRTPDVRTLALPNNYSSIRESTYDYEPASHRDHVACPGSPITAFLARAELTLIRSRAVNYRARIVHENGRKENARKVIRMRGDPLA